MQLFSDLQQLIAGQILKTVLEDRTDILIVVYNHFFIQSVKINCIQGKHLEIFSTLLVIGVAKINYLHH